MRNLYELKRDLIASGLMGGEKSTSGLAAIVSMSCEVIPRLSYIPRDPASHPNWHIYCGFRGHSSETSSAIVLRDSCFHCNGVLKASSVFNQSEHGVFAVTKGTFTYPNKAVLLKSIFKR